MGIAATGYMIVVVVMSLVCFIAYGIDKRQAANGGRRVSEPTLHLMAFLGGWPGALMGQRQFNAPDAPKVEEFAKPEDRPGWQVYVWDLGGKTKSAE